VRVTSPDLPHSVAAFLAAFVAGCMNAIAGGGTLVTFPTLLWLGLPSIAANATNTVAIWPGSLGSIWGFRRELGRTSPRMRWLVIPSFAGGAFGAVLLRLTPPGIFDRLVPFLILFATLLFSLQGPINNWLGHAHGTEHRSGGWFAGVMFMQLAVSVYGGYFGAGMGIMMLTALSVLGMTDILEMNALTSLYGLCINGIAAVLFIQAQMVYWPFVLVMAAGAIAGGYGAAGVARRIGRKAVRRSVVAIGFSIAAALFVRMFRGG
jgi:uncharacterized membrane protein YfcA